MITASDGRQVPCIFSMGNFVSSMGKDINNDTIVLRIVLERENGKAVIGHAGYIPCRVFPEYEGGHHVVVPVSAALNGGRTSPALDQVRNRIISVVGTDVFSEISAIGSDNAD